MRYANAGTVDHPFHPHGKHLKAIAQDGRLLGAAGIETFTRTIAAGQTYDLLFNWTNVENWQTCSATFDTSCFTGDPDGRSWDRCAPGCSCPAPLDLTFKDNVTSYSGESPSRFPGCPDDLPPELTSFNECGEFYFPWHSHALQTVQNDNEGFGGMLTMVRIDPPGGCPAVAAR